MSVNTGHWSGQEVTLPRTTAEFKEGDLIVGSPRGIFSGYDGEMVRVASLKVAPLPPAATTKVKVLRVGVTEKDGRPGELPWSGTTESDRFERGIHSPVAFSTPCYVVDTHRVPALREMTQDDGGPAPFDIWVEYAVLQSYDASREQSADTVLHRTVAVPTSLLPSKAGTRGSRTTTSRYTNVSSH